MSAKKYKIFISSVQKEFEHERLTLQNYFANDVLLKSFFYTFIFEKISATSIAPELVYVEEVKRSDIYIGLLGKTYGFEDESGISPTEKEYNTAKGAQLTRWIYILNTTEKRAENEERFIQKVSKDVSWKFFTDIESLKKEVYHSCIEFLKQRGKIENTDFDSSLHDHAGIDDVNDTLLKEFVELARDKRNFSEKPNASKHVILKRLNLLRDNKVTNSALLLFSENPQQFFPSATVKCAHFHGDHIQKPIPDYKEFTGTIFEMADSAVDFVLSKISLSTGTRHSSNIVETQYEIPRSAISEAIINALAHRDYYSNASVQISVFKNRIEIENPGQLPREITIEDLKQTHASYPNNPLLAKCLFLAGAIESYGTGIADMIQDMINAGLPMPDFSSNQSFKVRLWKDIVKPEMILQKEQDREQDREQDKKQLDEKILQLVRVLYGEMSASQLMNLLCLKARRNFMQNYLQPAIEQGIVEMSSPDKPTLKTQTYRLSDAGETLKTGFIQSSAHVPDVAHPPHDTPHDTPHDIYNLSPAFRKFIRAFEGEMTRQEIQSRMKIKDRKYFRQKYLSPAINLKFVTPVGEYNPKDKTQKYKLTDRGLKLQQDIKES